MVVSFDAMASTPSPSLRVKDVVAKYGLTERFVRHLVNERRIPHYKVGKNLLFDEAELADWFAEQRVEVV